MTKIIKVKNCEDCPKGIYNRKGKYAFCCMTGELVINYPNIPKWCPLEDDTV